MATLRLYLDTRVKRQDGTFSIRLAVNHHGGTAFISLNQYCKKDEWDKRACKVRKRPDRDAINDFLLDRLNFYNRMMMKAQCRETYRGDITARELRDLIMLEAEPAREKVALLRDGFIAYEGRNLKENTINRYKYTWAKIEAFLGKEKRLCLHTMRLTALGLKTSMRSWQRKACLEIPEPAGCSVSLRSSI